jgi:hypothetical protein
MTDAHASLGLSYTKFSFKPETKNLKAETVNSKTPVAQKR